MPKPSRSPHLLDLAKRGAEVRARLLAEELRLLFSAFPHLKDAFSADDLPLPFLLKSGAERQPSTPMRKRKPMSANSRTAGGERMKQSRAARRAAGDK